MIDYSHDPEVNDHRAGILIGGRDGHQEDQVGAGDPCHRDKDETACVLESARSGLHRVRELTQAALADLIACEIQLLWEMLGYRKARGRVVIES